MGIASLVLGILAIIFGLTINWIGIILGVVGIVLGVLAKKNNGEDGAAKAGFITSIIGTALAVIFWLACLACSYSANQITQGVVDEAYKKSMRNNKELKNLSKELDKALKKHKK